MSHALARHVISSQTSPSKNPKFLSRPVLFDTHHFPSIIQPHMHTYKTETATLQRYPILGYIVFCDTNFFPQVLKNVNTNSATLSSASDTTEHLLPRDVLLTVGDVLVQDLAWSELCWLLLGPANTTVLITVLRHQDEEEGGGGVMIHTLRVQRCILREQFIGDQEDVGYVAGSKVCLVDLSGGGKKYNGRMGTVMALPVPQKHTASAGSVFCVCWCATCIHI